jgi:alginate O-acetyltransferase complex protein AlgI
MEFLSFKFASFIFTGLLVFHSIPGAQSKKFVIAGLNLSFILFLAPSWTYLAPFFIFLIVGFVFVQVVRVNKGQTTLMVLILSFVFLFMFFKQYSILNFLPVIQTPYFLTGFSYILFRILHLLVNIQGGGLKERISGLDYFNYTCFFLSIISGPIQQYEEYKAQEKKSLAFNADQKDIFINFSRIANGLIKIGIIAVLFDFVFTEFSRQMGNAKFPLVVTYFGAAILYTQFLYFNFSGYMDVAIGTGSLFGWQLPENFDKPFKARNFLEFWSRWHMTLSGWFKIYLFNPLLKLLTYKWPSKKASPYLGVISFFVTFFVMGVWHGSTQTFLVYGLFLGLGVSLNKLFQIKMLLWLGKNRYRILKEKDVYCLVGSAMTYAYFSLALTCLWMNDERFFSTIHALGAKGLLLSFVMASIASLLVLWFLSWLGKLSLGVAQGGSALKNNRYCSEIYLGCKFFLVCFVVVEGNIPEFVYKWF